MTIKEILASKSVTEWRETDALGESEIFELQKFITEHQTNGTLTITILSEYLKSRKLNPFIFNFEDNTSFVSLTFSIIHEADLSDYDARLVLRVFLRKFEIIVSQIENATSIEPDAQNIINAIDQVKPNQDVLTEDEEDYI